MNRERIPTADGSHTLRIVDWDEPYHSRHGAVAESLHVFVGAGLVQRAPGPVRILELGFGTGLNALLTWDRAPDLGLHVLYTGVEPYPLTESEWNGLDYPGFCDRTGGAAFFEALHRSAWDHPVDLEPGFRLHKVMARFPGFRPEGLFDLVYFDAFAPEHQPELWTAEVFGQVFASLAPGGVLVTYCAKGAVRRAMGTAGFTVERLPGPPGKREMLRASRPH